MFILMIAVLSSYGRITSGQVSIVGHGTLQKDTMLVLECKITSFAAAATWSHDFDVTSLTQCFSLGVCTNTGSNNYNFTSDSHGTNVTIYTLTSAENGITWTCTHSSFSANYTVLLSGATSNESKECFWGFIGAGIANSVVLVLLCYLYKTKQLTWKTFLWILAVGIVWTLIVGGVFYLLCKLGWVEAIIAGVITLLISVPVVTCSALYSKRNETKHVRCLQVASIFGIIVIIISVCCSKDRVDKERRKREDKERRDREDKERRDREDKERRDREDKERRDREDKERRDREDKERRDREDKERRKREDKERRDREDHTDDIDTVVDSIEQIISNFPEIVVVLATTIDKKGPSDFVWINEKGLKLTSNNSKSRLPSFSSPKKAALKERGIYQCVRTFKGGVKDTINVVLHVSDFIKISLTVHPMIWAEIDLKDLHPHDLNTKVSEINKGILNEGTIHEEMSVKWEFYANQLGKYKTLPHKDIKLDADESGVYKCSVKLNLSTSTTQVYFFCVQFLDGNETKQNNVVNVIGVPSIPHI